MAARDEASKSPNGDQVGPPARASPARGKPGNEAVLRALAEVEQTLARLKQARAERAEAEARYKAELAERDASERTLVAERDRLAAALAEASGRIDALQGEISGVRGLDASHIEALGAERDEAVEAGRRLAREKAECEEELQRERAERARLEAALNEASALHEELARARAAEGELRAAFEKLQARAQQIAAQLSDTSADADRWRSEAEAAASAGQELLARVSSLESELREARERSASDAEEARAALSSRDQRLAEVEAERTRLESALAHAGERLAERTAEAGESAQNAAILASKVTELETRVWEISTALEEARRDAAALQSGEESAAGRISELSGLLEETRAEAERLRADCTAALDAAARAGEEAQAVAARHEEQLASERASFEAKLHEAGLRMEQLGASAGESAAAIEQLRALQEQLAAIERERDTFRAQAEQAGAIAEEKQRDLSSLHAKLDEAAEQLEALQAALAERDEQLAGGGDQGAEIVKLRAELERAKQDLASARASGKRGKRAASPEAAERWRLRRDRLRRVRLALDERQRQFDRASSVLAERVKLCDELLSRRRELAEAREIVERTHRKIVGGRARTSAAAVVFFATSLLVVLAGASWTIVNQFFPASYAANAVLAADFRGVTPEPGEPESWQSFHEQLLFDPQLLGRVAERMRQRGFEELGGAAVVKTKLEQDLSWSSPEPGKLVLELRGVGREPTARMLDVYSTTLEVEANSLRPKRNDSAQTIIAERSRAGSEPIADERPERAAIGLAAAAAFATLLWGGIWRRMVKTKKAFEHATEIDHLLEEARWADPIQQIIDSRNESATGKAA